MQFEEPQTIFELINEKEEKSGIMIFLSTLLIIIGIVIILIIAGASYLAVVSPKLKLKEFNELFKQDSQNHNEESIFIDSSTFLLKKQEAFIKSRLLKSELDSISLSINLRDSVLSLDIKGVSIYNVKIDYIELSPLFDQLDKSSLLNCFSSPFYIKYQYATVVKEPIVIKNAPKDTIEYNNQSAPNIDTLKPKMVAYYFSLSKGILLDIRQSEKTEILPYYKYIIGYNYWYTNRQLRQIIKRQQPDYLPWIHIKINCKDALAIYRALPHKAYISIHL